MYPVISGLQSNQESNLIRLRKSNSVVFFSLLNISQPPFLFVCLILWQELGPWEMT